MGPQEGSLEAQAKRLLLSWTRQQILAVGVHRMTCNHCPGDYPFVCPSNSYVKALTPKVMALEVGPS